MFIIDRGEGRGGSQNCNNKTPQKGPRPYSSSTTEALARESTRGSVGLSESGRFLPVDLRGPRYAIEQSAALETKRTLSRCVRRRRGPAAVVQLAGVGLLRVVVG